MLLWHQLSIALALKIALKPLAEKLAKDEILSDSVRFFLKLDFFETQLEGLGPG